MFLLTTVAAGQHGAHGEHAERIGHEHSAHASYRLQCDNLVLRDSVNIALFASFPDIYEIKAQWLTSGQQGAAKLTAQHTSCD